MSVKWTPERLAKFRATMKAKKGTAETTTKAKAPRLRATDDAVRVRLALHALHQAFHCWPKEAVAAGRLPISKAKALVVLAIKALEGE